MLGVKKQLGLLTVAIDSPDVLWRVEVELVHLAPAQGKEPLLR